MQVIYKKFNILCPLEEHHDNITYVDDHSDANSTDDFCEAKLFTVNSQVRIFPAFCTEAIAATPEKNVFDKFYIRT